MKKINSTDLYEKNISHINIGSGEEISISDLSRLIKKIAGFRGELIFDPSKPDGMPRKLLDTSKLKELGWSPDISLELGIESTYNWYISKNKTK